VAWQGDVQRYGTGSGELCVSRPENRDVSLRGLRRAPRSCVWPMPAGRSRTPLVVATALPLALLVALGALDDLPQLLVAEPQWTAPRLWG